MLHALSDPNYILALAALLTAATGLIASIRALFVSSKANQKADVARKAFNGPLEAVASETRRAMDTIAVNRANIEALQQAFRDFFGTEPPSHAAPPTSSRPPEGPSGSQQPDPPP